jgi:hypothetical protein
LSNNRTDTEAGEERFTETLLSVKVKIEKILVIHFILSNNRIDSEANFKEEER